MNKLNKQTKLLVLAFALLLIIGVANYFNYYAPDLSEGKVLSFSSLSPMAQHRLINGAKHQKKLKLFNFKRDEKPENEKSFSSAHAGDNYLTYAVDSNGKLVKWKKKKLKVYISPSEYKETIQNALNQYNSYFEEYFTFYPAKTREDSDIKIDVVDHFSSNDNQDSIYMAGITNNTFSGDDKRLTNSIIQILSKKPNSTQKVTDEEVFRVVLHEMGHALGIIGHSPNSSDVMFASSNVEDFSQRDINTLKLMYSNNDEAVQKETKDYADVKLKEAEDYAKDTPNKAISWVNLGKVYYDLNKKEEALDAYKKALEIEPDNPLIYQSMAECYYSSEKYETAIKYYNYALDCAKTDEVKNPFISMIGMCYAKMEDFDKAYYYFKRAFEFDKNNKTMLKNYLVACVETDRKQEATNAINLYSEKHPSIVNEKFIQDVMKWAK